MEIPSGWILTAAARPALQPWTGLQRIEGNPSDGVVTLHCDMPCAWRCCGIIARLPPNKNDEYRHHAD
jgi:hypothetical protein